MTPPNTKEMPVLDAEKPTFDYPSTAHAACPWPVLADIRAAGSVHRLGDSDRYLVSHYDDVEFVLTHEELFSGGTEERIASFDWPGPEGVPPESLGKRTGQVLSVIELDPPVHKRRRERMFRLVKPARVRGFRPWIEELVDELIDGFADRGEVEFMHEFAYRLPTHLIMRILGFDREDFDWIHQWGLPEWKGGRVFMNAEELARQTDSSSIGPRVTAEILERVERPRDDGLTEMIQGQIEDDGAFNLGIVRADLGQFVRAGITTTGHLLSSVMYLLTQHPQARELVAADHSRIRGMVEEALRTDSPLQWIPRRVRQDVELGGVAIPEGSYLIVMLQSANRDEARWGESACTFDPERPNAIDHLAFGKGPHFCLGAPLGRLEMEIALGKLLTRLTNFRLAGGREPVWKETPTFRGLTELNLEFDVAEAGR
jgi:cytochrome P450